jgi:signal transduction histidine kinase
MDKSQQHIAQGKQRSDAALEKKRAFRSRPSKVTAESRDGQNEVVRCEQLEAIFVCLPESIIACDQDGKILRLNAAALKLFDVSSEDQCRGMPAQEFFEHYAPCDEQQQPIAPGQWFRNASNDGAVTSRLPEEFVTLRLSSRQRVPVKMSSLRVFDTQEQERGTVFVFHELSYRYQKALHLQRVHEAVLALTEAIAHLPEHFPVPDAIPSSREPLLMLPTVVFIAQQLVEVIRRVLDCRRVCLKAFEWPAGYIHFVAGSGFTAAQEEPERTTSDLITLSEALGKAEIDRLRARQEVVIPGNRVHIPPGFANLDSESLLLVPLFVGRQLTGMLAVVKAGVDSVYTPEEIELVKAVAEQAVLIVECLRYLHFQDEIRVKELAMHEVHRLSNDFLILASHELRTPLTGVLGNLQLAQHRLEMLQQEVEYVSEHIAQAQQPLASAARSARLQQRIINDIVDDARIQTNQLELYRKRLDLLALIKSIVSRQQRLAPEHTIVLEVSAEVQEVPALADTERITRVFTTYLANALAYSPTEQSVIVQVTVEDQIARVSVHNEGPGISPEEQKHLWERFYRSKGSTVQHELDLSLGFGLYLCKELIKRHGGSVGVQSARDYGATFWFALPLAR